MLTGYNYTEKSLPNRDLIKVEDNKSPKYISMILQLTILFVAGVLMVGTIMAIVQYDKSFDAVNDQLTESASKTARDISSYLNHFPARDWLLKYWYEHYDELDIDYDTRHEIDDTVAEKSRKLVAERPDFLINYATPEELEAMPPEDQKAYAEIVYSWLIVEVDNHQADYGIDFIFCVVTEPPYEKGFVLFSGVDADDVSTGNTERFFPIGTILTAGGEQKEGVSLAVDGDPQLVRNSNYNYMDYYYPLARIDGHDYVLGITRSLSKYNAQVMERTLRLTFLSMAFIAAMAVLCLLLVYYSIVQPLRRIQKTIREYTGTKDSRTVEKNLSEIQSSNEIGILSDDFIALSRELDDYAVKISEAASQEERISTELELASRIQSGMVPRVFPRYPDRKDFSAYGTMNMARDVGGDFFDFFLVDDDHLCMMIADVSGKGIPAALFMMASTIIIANNTLEGKSPAEALESANNTICGRNQGEMFVTVWLGMLELSTGRLTAVNAGHENPVLMQPEGLFEMIRDSHGPMVGAMEEMAYSEYELQLKPGARLFLYTDGLPEAMDADKKMFGMDRTLIELNKLRDVSDEEVLDGMKKAVAGFVKDAEQFDDLTMLCVTYNGPQD